MKNYEKMLLTLLQEDLVYVIHANGGGLRIAANCSEMFYKCCTDYEDVVKMDDLDELFEFYEKYGRIGKNIWIMKKRGMRSLPWHFKWIVEEAKDDLSYLNLGPCPGEAEWLEITAKWDAENAERQAMIDERKKNDATS